MPRGLLPRRARAGPQPASVRSPCAQRPYCHSPFPSQHPPLLVPVGRLQRQLPALPPRAPPPRALSALRCASSGSCTGDGSVGALRRAAGARWRGTAEGWSSLARGRAWRLCRITWGADGQMGVLSFPQGLLAVVHSMTRFAHNSQGLPPQESGGLLHALEHRQQRSESRSGARQGAQLTRATATAWREPGFQRGCLMSNASLAALHALCPAQNEWHCDCTAAHVLHKWVASRSSSDSAATHP